MTAAARRVPGTGRNAGCGTGGGRAVFSWRALSGKTDGGGEGRARRWLVPPVRGDRLEWEIGLIACGRHQAARQKLSTRSAGWQLQTILRIADGKAASYGSFTFTNRTGSRIEITSQMEENRSREADGIHAIHHSAMTFDHRSPILCS